MGLSTLLDLGGGRESVELQLTDKTRTATSNPFVQHMVLNPNKSGEDNPGFVVRAKEGLDGCEYLSEVPLVKPGKCVDERCCD